MIYLFDKDEKLIKIVRKSAVKTALQKYALTTERYVSDRLTVELKGLNADELEQVEYMAIQTMEDAHAFHYFYVAQKFSDELATLIGVQSGIEELRKSPIFDKRPQNAFAREVVDDLLAGTNWQARFVGETTAHSTNFYYTSVFDALKKVCEVWDLEMQFFVEMNGNRIGGRYIDFKQRIGEAVGKRVVYGHNALQILQEVERTNIFTALIGRGKGEETGDGYGRKITFENVVWSTTQGKPVNKPKGQKHLELPLMTRQYGIKNADGSMRPKIGFVDFSEEENPEALIERTYKALIDAARPQLTLKTSSVYLKGVKVGDTIRVVRHDKKLDYDTRIFEITFNRLNNQSSDIKLGDRIGESNEAKAQTIADKAVEQFVNNEFSNFVQNLPDYLPSADGFNNNWYGAEVPTVQYPGKVLINDIWFKPDPEHEGHKIMLRWTGEVWEEILRTYDSEALRDRIAEEIAQVNQSMQAQSDEHDRQVADILSQTQSIEGLANQAKTDAVNAINGALEAKQLAQAAGGQISQVQLAVDEANRQILQRVTKAEFNPITQRLSSAEATILTQAVQIEQRLTSTQVNNLVDSKGYQTASQVQSVVTQTADSLTRTISQVEAKIPTDVITVKAFNETKDTVNTHTRTIGSVGASGSILDNISQVTQTAAGLVSRVSLITDAQNLVYDPTRYSKYVARNSTSNLQKANYSQYSAMRINHSGLTTDMYSGFRLPLRTSTFAEGEKLSLRAVIGIGALPDSGGQIKFEIKNQGNIIAYFWLNPTRTGDNQIFTATTTVNISTTAIDEYGLDVLINRNGNVNITQISIVRGGQVPTSFVDSTTSQDLAISTQVSQLADSYAIKTLNAAGDVLSAVNVATGAVSLQSGQNKLIVTPQTTFIQDGTIQSAMIASLDAGKIVTGTLDASKANVINLNASNIVSGTMAASRISGGALTALNNTTNFNLQTGWIDMNAEAVGIRNLWPNYPIQYLVFGRGAINGKTASYTALMSNSKQAIGMDDGSAGVQIWNAMDNTTAINLYGDEIVMMYNANDSKGLIFNNVNNTIGNVDNIYLSGYGNYNLVSLFNNIYDNLKLLHNNKTTAANYSYTLFGPR